MDVTFRYKPPEGRPKIIFQDNDFIGVEKPSGLLTVPGRQPNHKDSLFTRLKKDIPNILVVHRLDMDTSGIILFVKNKKSQSLLSQQFSKRLVKKLYVARVLGRITKLAGTITFPIAKDWPRRPLQKVCEVTGKFSKTNWRLLGTSKNKAGQIFSNLMIQPITGRTHQIRLHFNQIGLPIVGDKLYGNANCEATDESLNLHAYSIKFYHFNRGKYFRLTSHSKRAKRFLVPQKV